MPSPSGLGTPLRCGHRPSGPEPLEFGAKGRLGEASGLEKGRGIERQWRDHLHNGFASVQSDFALGTDSRWGKGPERRPEWELLPNEAASTLRGVRVLAGVKAELNQFGLHGDAGNAQPAGGLGLVALRLLDRPREHLALGGFEHSGVHIGHFTPAGSRQEFIHMFSK